MSKAYDPETLARLQAIEMMMVEDFVAVCERHHLQYWAFCGTGIGALRHQGFIPWDDDIDLYLPREDFNQLIHYMTTEYGDKYYALNDQTDPHYPLATTRMCLTGTVFQEEIMEKVDCRWGIFLDLYPVDWGSDKKSQFFFQKWRTWYYSKIVILYETPDPYLYIDGFKAKVVLAGCHFMHWFLHFFPFKKDKLIAKREKASQKYNHLRTGRLGYYCDTKPHTDTFELEDLYPLRALPYEKTTIQFPNQLEKLMTIMFGDYMTMPPVEKRMSHYPYKLEFGPYANIDIHRYLNRP